MCVADKLIPVAHSERFNELLKHSQLQMVENRGHAPFSEKRSVVFDIMRIFLTNKNNGDSTKCCRLSFLASSM